MFEVPEPNIIIFRQRKNQFHSFENEIKNEYSVAHKKSSLKIRCACFYCGPYRIKLSPKKSNCIFNADVCLCQGRWKTRWSSVDQTDFDGDPAENK